ncbi:leucyl aminopeptidase [Nocardioides limicola]|uniref:leucyl aminopeptidase n=1 Tax=Nocardioides limicola TaxID=2803368 RepID=UPI001EF0113A|nr:leucyl aminopeptidase [Nocardioides sp. DJM-14]
MPDVTSYSLRTASPAKTRADVVIVGVADTRKGLTALGPGADVQQAYGRKWRPLLSTLGFTAKANEVVKVPTSESVNSPLLMLVGLGETTDPTEECLRAAAGAAARALTNVASAAVALPTDTPERVGAVTEGFCLGRYTFTRYKSNAEDDPVNDIVVLSEGARRNEMVAAFDAAQAVANAVATARDWVNMPPGDLTPPLFAAAIEAGHAELTKGRGGPPVELTVYDEDALADLGCGGLLGVGVGSSAPPRLVELVYAPKDAVAHLALVGKGITFDSGGLSIKPAASMATMKCDMAGAATVVQATFAIAALGLPVKVSTFVPLAENMVSGTSTRPGDVLSLYGGTTVEVSNTDAEGRLVLADALVRATEVDPDVIVDVATLTGAMVMALGDRMAGVMGTDAAVAQVLAAAETAGEPMWAMPIPEEMSERVRSSKIADLAQHDAIRWGGGLFAAAFLREFTAGRPWAHVDVAGPAYNNGAPSGHLPSGGTGFGVATLVQHARTLASDTV